MTDTTIIPPARPQRPHSIKNLIPRLPERGRIAIGMKGEMITSKQGNQFQPPQKLDHFRVVTLDRGKDGNFLSDEAFHAKYGAAPTEIPVRLIFDDPDLSFQTRYGCYIGRTLWCSGDGETATRLTNSPTDLKKPGAKIEPREVPCTCPRQAPDYQGSDRCRMNGSLSVLIEDMGGVGGVWRWRTTSFNSILGVMSSLAFLRSVTGGILANIPLVLRVAPKQAVSPVNQQAVTIYIVSLEFAGTIAELQRYAHQIALDRATTRMSIEHIEDEARRNLALPGPADAILSGDEPDDVVQEFFPEQVEQMSGVIAPPRPTREQFEERPVVVDPPHDPQTGEIIEDTPPVAEEEAEEPDYTELLGNAISAAQGGVAEFRKFWAGLSIEDRAIINPDRAKYQAIAEKADAARPTQAGAVTKDTAPAPTVGSPATTGAAPQNSPAGPGPTAMKPASRSEPVERPTIFYELDWKIAMPLMQNRAPNYPILRDILCNLVGKCESGAEIEKMLKDNAEHMAVLDQVAKNYAETVRNLASTRQQVLGQGGV